MSRNTITAVIMGSRREYRCPHCNYAELVSGGIDVGMAVMTATVSCSTCRRLADVVISEKPWEGEPDLATLELVCPRARTRRHRCRLWSFPGPCPRCGETMEEGELMALWD